MSKLFSSLSLNRVFTTAILLIFGVFLAFLGYLYVAFSGVLIGDVQADIAPEVLKGLQTKKFETAVGRFETRAHLPDIPADIPNPFDAPKK